MADNKTTSNAISTGITTGSSTGNPYVGLAAGGAALLGGLFGDNAAGDERAAAERARQEALALYSGISIPTVEEQQLLLDQYASTGIMSPQLEAILNLGNTAHEGISLDPMARQAQVDSLAKMGEIATSGVTPEDRALFELARRNSAAESQAKQEQIMQNMQARGMGGSGAELANRLIAEQNSADRLQQAQLEEAAKRQNARMQALESQASMGGNLRASDYAEQEKLANARDVVTRFNVQNSQAANQRNTDRQNTAQQFNLQNNQNIANANVDLKNNQQKYNKGLLQTRYKNQMDMADSKANILAENAKAADTRAAQTAEFYGGMGQAVGTLIGGFGGKTTPTNTNNSSFNMDSLPKYNPATGRYE